MTTLEVLCEARDRGLSLSARGDGLVARPNRRLSPDFAHKLFEFKPTLLPLLQTKGVTWIDVHSERLGETIFFCADEQTRHALQDAGADEWAIYTRDELRILCEQNRIAPISQAELCKLHEIRKTFNATIRE
jgi:hypothetical protein